jgi:beta-glucosidase
MVGRRMRAPTLAFSLAVAVSATMASAPSATAGGRAAASPCPWVTSTAPIPQRVAQVMAKMTLADKIQEVHGVSGSPYVGYVAANPRLCIPALGLEDGPGGVGDGMTGVTQLPAPTAAAATWDTGLTRQYGTVIGAEQRGKGADVDLGPTVNIVRDPRWGRAFESYGEDPYLAGQLGAADVEGVQSTGTMAQIKHYAVYNQETSRNTPADDAVVDERTMQEIYLSQFDAALKQSKPSSVMCSYSWINGTPACQDGYTQNQVLRDQWGYQGFVTSDWGATHSTVESALGGLDMQMPDAQYYGSALQEAVSSGKVPMATLDGMVSRILTQMFRFGLFNRSDRGSPSATVTTPAHVAVARRVAEQGSVLLKNSGGLLPLSTSKTRSIAVIGDDAGSDAMTVGGGSAGVNAASIVTPYQGIAKRAGSRVTVQYAQGSSPTGALPVVGSQYLSPSTGTGHGLTGQYYTGMTLSGSPVATQNTPDLNRDWNGASPVKGVPATQWSAKFTGTLTPPATGTYTFSLTSDDGSRLVVDGQKVIDNWRDQAAHTQTGTVSLTANKPVSIEVDYYQNGGGSSLQLGWTPPGGPNLLQQAVDLAKASNVAVVFASKAESEGSDLSDIDLSADQNQLISAVSAANPNTIVVLNTGSAVTMPWLGSVKGVFEAWYPGQEDGDAIASLLFGDVNPSGKLPVSFPRSLADVPASTAAQWPGVNGKVSYSEGLDVGYRWYDTKGIAPAFPFGSGLSYTSFSFGNLHVSPSDTTSLGHVRASVDITNTGRREGADVVQLYVGDPASTGEPARQLKGFQKVDLRPGQTRRVTFDLPASALATWDAATHAWKVADGAYQIMVGDSSANLPRRATIHVTRSYGPQGLAVQAPSLAPQGKAQQVTATLTNEADVRLDHVMVRPDLPQGWTASPPAVTLRSVAAHAKATATFTVTAPATAGAGSYPLSATASFTEPRAGRATVKGSAATVLVPYPSFPAAYDSSGVSDDSDPAAGNFDGSGYSFSAQALAKVGITPGAAVTQGSVSFTWPDVAAGKPDEVTPRGQAISLSGSGGALYFLGAGTFGRQSGQVTVTYTDGSTSTGTITFADWYSNAPTQGAQLVATAPYWNVPAGDTIGPHAVSLYDTSVPLSQGKTISSITLPDAPQMHIFAVTVQ